MTKLTIATFTFSALTAGALGLAGAAAAVPQGSASAADTIKGLQDQGFAVRINGTVTGSLSRCTVTDVHGLTNSNVDSSGRRIDPTRFDAVTVDVFCPSHD